MAIIAVLLSIAFMVTAAIQTRVIASVDHPNGTRLRVIQYFNFQPELFTTSIYSDEGDGQWRWYYFDHEDSYWGSASTEINDSKILITSKNRRIEFETSTGECTTFHSDRNRFHKKSDTFKLLPDGVKEGSKPQENAG